jgi:hypothetical protein
MGEALGFLNDYRKLNQNAVLSDGIQGALWLPL